MRTTKIVYVCSTLRQSGPINQLFNIVSNLNKEKYNIDVVTLSQETSKSIREEFEKLNIGIHSLKLSRIKSLLYGSIKLKSVLSKINPDIVHSHSFRPDILVGSLDLEATKISTIHSSHYHHHRDEYGEVIGSMMAWLQIYSLQKFDRPIACSHFVADKINDHGISSDVVANGVNCEKYSPISNREAETLRHKLNIPVDDTVFIYVGSLSKGKDPITILDGFSKISDGNMSLLMLGDGELRRDCEKKSEGVENIQILGHVADPNLYLKASDYFISASQFEGLPMAVLEAMSTGLPVCLSDIPPHQEILSHNSEAGVLFDTSSPTALAEALEKLYHGRYNKKSQLARSTIKNHYSARQMAASYSEIYETI